MEETCFTSKTTILSAFLLSASSRQTSASFFDSIGSKLAAAGRKDKAPIWRSDRSPGLHQAPGFLPLLHLMEEKGRGEEVRFIGFPSPRSSPHSFLAGRGWRA